MPAPGETSATNEEKELPQKPGDTTIRKTNVTRPTITVFEPAAEKKNGTAVVICPGGGYNILAFNKEGTEVAQWLNSIGVTGVVLKYRVPTIPSDPKHLRPLQDAQRTVSLVRQSAGSRGLDPAHIGILGFSAGGHLAASLSTNYDRAPIRPATRWIKSLAVPDFTLLVYPAYLVDKENRLAPEIKVNAQTPRAFLVHTEDDGRRRSRPACFITSRCAMPRSRSKCTCIPTVDTATGCARRSLPCRPGPSEPSNGCVRRGCWPRSRSSLCRLWGCSSINASGGRPVAAARLAAAWAVVERVEMRSATLDEFVARVNTRRMSTSPAWNCFSRRSSSPGKV